MHGGSDPTPDLLDFFKALNCRVIPWPLPLAGHPPLFLMSPSVSKFMDVIEQSVVREGVVCVRTVVVASTGLDHHDVLRERFAIIAAEADLHSPGLLRSTTPPIHTRATVFGTILLDA